MSIINLFVRGKEKIRLVELLSSWWRCQKMLVNGFRIQVSTQSYRQASCPNDARLVRAGLRKSCSAQETRISGIIQLERYK